MKQILGLLAVGLLAGPMVASANIIYQVNQSFDGGSITGTITTDGTLGVISTIAPFVDWTLTLNDGVNSSSLNFLSSWLSGGTFRWTATTNDLSFDHTFGSYFFLDGGVGYWCLEGPADGCSGYSETSNFRVDVGGIRGRDVISSQFPTTVFAAVPAPVPLPAAAWLLVSGLGGLGVLGRRRKAA